MVKITNHTRGTMDFIVAVKNGMATTDHVDGGETKDIKLLNPRDPTVIGRVLAGAITVEGMDIDAPAASKRHASTDRRVAAPPAGE